MLYSIELSEQQTTNNFRSC